VERCLHKHKKDDIFTWAPLYTCDVLCLVCIEALCGFLFKFKAWTLHYCVVSFFLQLVFFLPNLNLFMFFFPNFSLFMLFLSGSTLLMIFLIDYTWRMYFSFSPLFTFFLFGFTCIFAFWLNFACTLPSQLCLSFFQVHACVPYSFHILPF
jgi:hypothetical protein